MLPAVMGPCIRQFIYLFLPQSSLGPFNQVNPNTHGVFWSDRVMGGGPPHTQTRIVPESYPGIDFYLSTSVKNIADEETKIRLLVKT